jgi:hypothetical protein
MEPSFKPVNSYGAGAFTADVRDTSYPSNSKARSALNSKQTLSLAEPKSTSVGVTSKHFPVVIDDDDEDTGVTIKPASKRTFPAAMISAKQLCPKPDTVAAYGGLNQPTYQTTTVHQKSHQTPNQKRAALMKNKPDEEISEISDNYKSKPTIPLLAAFLDKEPLLETSSGQLQYSNGRLKLSDEKELDIPIHLVNIKMLQQNQQDDKLYLFIRDYNEKYCFSVRANRLNKDRITAFLSQVGQFMKFKRGIPPMRYLEIMKRRKLSMVHATV